MDYAVIHHSKSNIDPSGDAYFISRDHPRLFLLADGLGSGEEAREAAEIAASTARTYCCEDAEIRKDMLPDFFINCHKKLKYSRGIAMGAVIFDEENKQLLFSGVGNVRLILAGNNIKSILCQPGIVGLQLPRLISVKTVSTKDYIMGFLFSDGISIRSVLEAAETPFRLPSKLADEINMLNGNSDDKTLIVFKLVNGGTHFNDQV